MSILSSQISKPEEIEPVLGALAGENTCPDVVILDANLRSGDNGGDDARRVTRVLRDMKMAPLVLGFSANLFPPDIVVARSCIKDSDTIRALPRIIAEMLSESAA